VRIANEQIAADAALAHTVGALEAVAETHAKLRSSIERNTTFSVPEIDELIAQIRDRTARVRDRYRSLSGSL
jgi:hypothetical protein